MARRIWLTLALTTLLSSVGCTRNWCEHHGYYPAAPAAAYPQQCCVPVCPCGPAPAGYAAPAAAPGWNAPTGGYGQCCPPPPH